MGHSSRQASVTEAHNRNHLLRKGNAAEGSDPLFLPVQIPGAANQEDQGRGVTKQNLIWPAQWSISAKLGENKYMAWNFYQ